MVGDAAPQFDQHTCCGVVQEATYRAREKREQKTKQPWIVRKLAVGIAVGILAYATYVYIGRFCVPMITRARGALGSRSMGIGFLVVFCIFAMMTYWSYLKVILTPPGFAKDHVSPSPEPQPSTTARFDDSWEEGMGGFQYEGASYSADEPPQNTPQPPAAASHDVEKRNGGVMRANGSTHPVENAQIEDNPNTGDLDAIPPVAAAKAAIDPTLDAAAPAHPRSVPEVDGPSRPSNPPRVKSESSRAGTSAPKRRPPTTPVLLPEYRYCYKEKFVKPLRAHHCRSCGTCILRFDHHCPWIGQCVGALNHRFFYIFCEWAAVLCIWIFATLLAQNVKAGNSLNPYDSPDGQQIAVIALAGLFMMFTLAMIGSHTRMIMFNQTTVEHLGVQRMKERERAILGNAFAWYQISEKRRVRKEWDEEWGELGREGNLWWLGSYRANWESVMGSSVYEWFLPIGKAPTNGVEFRTNPRFDEQGRWRPRREWPEGLR
ncbi:zf-DHHC-domain-containing protein [Gloeophyllum trabeum ATCC 11539]|uniref:Palmitoyltransferase n=1 Tax=Gloeophyllum trabeum (strain ATCC 11539 / FP-39264 / Madison 617) TaxID=670483 RepID=S7RSC9_GLOTA|nr:zf-DHHC-domain-containing protein [Gloeophyllum trabeum ATCC 11539]EPQ55934.1 zf-DHHC-domain-containing protein [Gloeophyllum trabeum ATCC 11539]